MNDTLAVRLLISRRDLKFNQEDVADRAGVSRAYVSDLERGKVDNPTLDVVTSLARVLQVRPEYLIGWSDDPLGEDRPGNVAEGRVVYEVNGPAEYRRVQELLELFNELTPEDQRILLEIAGRLRRVGDVRIVGEWALSDLLDELGRAGVSQAEIDALEAQALEVMEAE